MRIRVVTLATLFLLPVAMVGTAVLTSCAMNKKEKEETVTLDSVPAAVRATIEKHSAGGTIKEIEREEEDGKTVYEAEVMKDGKKWEFEVGADGTLLEGPKEDKDDAEDDDHGKEKDD